MEERRRATIIDVLKSKVITTQIFKRDEDYYLSIERLKIEHDRDRVNNLDAQEILKRTIRYKGKEINNSVDVQENYDMIAKFAMPYDYIKHYLPSTMYPIKDWYDDVNEHFQVYHRTLAIDRYVQHPNATLDTLKKLIDWHPSFKPSNVSVEKAALHGHIEIIRYLDQLYNRRKYDMLSSYYTEVALENASQSGCLELVERILQSHNFYLSKQSRIKAINNAAQKGHFNIVRWLFPHDDRVQKEWKVETIDLACHSCNVELIQWLYQHGCRPSADAMDILSSRGCMEGIQYLHFECCQAKCTTYAMDWAAYSGYLSIVQFLDQHRTEGATTRAMDYAARNGHFETVKWLHFNRTEGCSVNAMDGAAERGHEDIFKFLHTHRTEGCSVNAMDGAAERGHEDIFKFLHTHRTEGCTKRAMYKASENGHIQIVQFIHLNRTEWYDIDIAMKQAATGNQLDILKFLHIIRNSNEYSHIMDSAVYSNNIDMLEWLHENYRGHAYDPQKMATRVGNLCVLQWFLGKYGLLEEYQVKSCLKAAACFGHMAIINWLVETHPHIKLEPIIERIFVKCVDRAAAEGNVDVIRWFYKNATSERTQVLAKEVLGNLLTKTMKYGRLQVLRWLINTDRLQDAMDQKKDNNNNNNIINDVFGNTNTNDLLPILDSNYLRDHPEIYALFMLALERIGIHGFKKSPYTFALLKMGQPTHDYSFLPDIMLYGPRDSFRRRLWLCFGTSSNRVIAILVIPAIVSLLQILYGCIVGPVDQSISYHHIFIFIVSFFFFAVIENNKTSNPLEALFK
ncbi:hypothetical protein DFA_08993 [Cavenderia fasciculata]|uniref:Ankyrin repeat-containing protein n=1 Tax=Cavenderia fasciculata TaxID=261658 RepID=F4Q6E5_CACFS|nr:uncharacterized protein DFA_08993 [Cavenderia fasciculata]EGG16455.1 hypothetical protein DFA_08993 [Cavenderia fasciculata]|eukprot:XP_004354855.1 hypothetical protein DFA_08993 [Cavenderia fasciculata]